MSLTIWPNIEFGRKCPLLLCGLLLFLQHSLPSLSLINNNDVEFFYLTLFTLSGPLIPKLFTQPHAPIHSAEAFWESTSDGACWRILFWVRGRSHLLGHLNLPAHEMQELSWVPYRVRGIASLTCCAWAPKQLCLYPECLQLPHENSLFGFSSKPSV